MPFTLLSAGVGTLMDPQLGEWMDWRVCRTYGTEVIYHSDKGIYEMQKNVMI